MSIFKTRWFIVLHLLILLNLTACKQSDLIEREIDSTVPTNEFEEKNNLVLALGPEPEEGFDPTLGWGRYGSPLFQSTLFTFDQQFNMKMDLAHDYEVSEDQLEWKIRIRDDVLFSNGEPLTAKDVAFTFEKAKANQSILDLQNVHDIMVEDDYTVVFQLAKPQSSFVYLLAMIGIVPEEAYSDSYSEKPIGSGPYKMLQWDKGQQLIVEVNPYYYGKKPIFERITFLFLDEDAAFTAAKAGELDLVAIPPHFASESIENMKLIALESVDNRGIMFPYVARYIDEANNLPIGHDVTSDIAIRKAINLAVDREELIKSVLDGYGTPAYSVVDRLPWWNSDTVFQDGDFEAANEFLVNAGWQKNEEGIYEKNGLKASFTLIYPSNDQTRQSLAMVFSKMMNEFGIEVKVEGKSWAEIPDLMFSTPVLMGWGSHDPLEMYYIYHSDHIGDGYHNANYYQNKKVDDYMDKALYAKTEEEANEWWKKAQWDGETGFSAIGDAPWAWLVNLQHLYYVNENLEIGEQKIQPHGHGWPITEFISNWYWLE